MIYKVVSNFQLFFKNSIQKLIYFDCVIFLKIMYENMRAASGRCLLLYIYPFYLFISLTVVLYSLNNNIKSRIIESAIYEK